MSLALQLQLAREAADGGHVALRWRRTRPLATAVTGQGKWVSVRARRRKGRRGKGTHLCDRLRISLDITGARPLTEEHAALLASLLSLLRLNCFYGK